MRVSACLKAFWLFLHENILLLKKERTKIVSCRNKKPSVFLCPGLLKQELTVPKATWSVTFDVTRSEEDNITGSQSNLPSETMSPHLSTFSAVVISKKICLLKQQQNCCAATFYSLCRTHTSPSWGLGFFLSVSSCSGRHLFFPSRVLNRLLAFYSHQELSQSTLNVRIASSKQNDLKIM